jgi:hypothetical protein
MLPMWVLALPIWLVVFIVLYALATLYFAIRYREARKFLAGVLARGRVGICESLAYRFRLSCHMSISVETPEISGQRAIVHAVLFLLCFYFGCFNMPREHTSVW